MPTIDTLALDLEGTLISNAVSQFARPGLARFLEFCRSSFPQVIVYTGVEERRFRRVAGQLIMEGSAPRWFGNTPHLYWGDEFKDLRKIPDARPETSLLVDDLEDAIHPLQKHRWVPIAPFERPYPSSDKELARVRRVLEEFQQY